MDNGLSARVSAIGESQTLTLDAKAKGLRDGGASIVSFAAGEPNFDTPPHIVEAAHRALDDATTYRYSPVPGLPELRDAIAESSSRGQRHQVNGRNVLICNGGKHAVFNALAAVINPGDEVVLTAPYWTTYPEVITWLGGRPVIVSTSADNGFIPSEEALKAATTERTKAFIYSSPSNPSGAVYPPEAIEAICAWASRRGIWILADEIYSKLVYNPSSHASVINARSLDTERYAILGGVAKSYAMTGWRVGWVVGPHMLISAISRLQSHTTSNVCNVSQHAALAAVTGSQAAVTSMISAFDRRRRRVIAGLNQIPGFQCPDPGGAFYVFPSVQELIGKTILGREVESSAGLTSLLLDEARVVLVPGEAFGTPAHVRLSYALGDSDLDRGLERIATVMETVAYSSER